MFKKKAFSLIELLVVIAIVGILTGTAIASYKNYLVAANLSKLTAALNAIVDQSIKYSAIQGRFGSLYDLGLTTTPGATVADDASVSALLGSYYLPITSGGGLYQNTDPQNCGRYANFQVFVDATKLGIDSSLVDNPNVWIVCQIAQNKGSINRFCVYAYGTASQSQTGSLIPGMVNANITSGWDQTNQTNLGATLLSNSSC